MIIPLQITWQDVDKSEALDSVIQEKAAKLDQFYQHIVGCRAMVEASHRHHHKGNLYRIRLEIEVPDDEIAVPRGPGDEHAHEDM